MEKNLINAQKILMQMLQDDSVIRASEQKVYWNYGAYIEKLKNLDSKIFSKIEPTLERLEDVWSLENGISRAAVVESSKFPDSHGDEITDPLCLLVSSTIFGYGSNSYGPSRLFDMLNSKEVEDISLDIYDAAQKDADVGHRSLFIDKKTRIKNLATSMGSKFIYFASSNNTKGPLIFDSRVFDAMNYLALVDDRANPKKNYTKEYVNAVNVIHHLSELINVNSDSQPVSSDDIECALFQFSSWNRRTKRKERII